MLTNFSLSTSLLYFHALLQCLARSVPCQHAWNPTNMLLSCYPWYYNLLCFHVWETPSSCLLCLKLCRNWILLCCLKITCLTLQTRITANHVFANWLFLLSLQKNFAKWNRISLFTSRISRISSPKVIWIMDKDFPTNQLRWIGRHILAHNFC